MLRLQPPEARYFQEGRVNFSDLPNRKLPKIKTTCRFYILASRDTRYEKRNPAARTLTCGQHRPSLKLKTCFEQILVVAGFSTPTEALTGGAASLRATCVGTAKME